MCALGMGVCRVCATLCVCSFDASIALSALDMFSQFKAENFL